MLLMPLGAGDEVKQPVHGHVEVCNTCVVIPVLFSFSSPYALQGYTGGICAYM